MEFPKSLYSYSKPAHLTLQKTNLDVEHSSFYHQFSFEKSFVEINSALEDLKGLPPFQLASLHFMSGTCDEFQSLISDNIAKVLTSKNSNEKALVFIHLVTWINRLRHETDFHNQIYTSIHEIQDRVISLSRLTSLIEKLDAFDCFRAIDLSRQNLNNLNLTRLRLHLTEANFDHASLVRTNFTGVALHGSTFNNVDLSTAIGINLSTVIGTPPSSCSRSDLGDDSDEQQDADLFVQTKPTCGKCIIM